MIFKTILLPVCIVLAGFSRYTSAAYGDTCSTTTACTAADNTECVQSAGCTNSACTGCKTGYTLTGGACKADIGTACSVVGDCAISTGSECNAGTSLCACTAANTYSTTYKACVTTDKQFGATCAVASVDTDCAVVSGSNGACISLQCDCASGYIKGQGHACRKPYYGEACTNAVGCISMSMLGEQAPECPAGATSCQCASTDEVITYAGVSYCATKVTAANKIANTLTCTNHNECSSGKCYQCPDTSGLICISTTSGSPTTMVKPAIIVMVTLITGLLQL